MKRAIRGLQWGLGLAAAALTTGALAAPATVSGEVTGDYVESRSANVYVGACHHEGEIQTAGRNALMAWRISDGEYNGVSLKGGLAVAVVASDRNLSLDGVKRRSVLYLDAAAPTEQRQALAALLQSRANVALGEVVAVKSANLSFANSGDTYRVNVEGVAQMKVKKEAGQLCCKQPYEVWGKPFVPVTDARVGYCISTEYKESGLLQSWKTTEQNNAFFGKFRL